MFADPAALALLVGLACQGEGPETAPAVLTGIDVLVETDFGALRGRRVGLISNHTGLDRRGRRTVDLLADAAEVELVSLFSPEHGFGGELERSEIGDSTDAESGLVVHSLYGATRVPTPEMLVGIDTLVFDIQDIGCRFYTYVSTMGLAMEAAAEGGLGFVVLDRPNPIGGELVEGPVLDAGLESFVGFHALPVRHGMTAGELARMFRTERELDLELEVVELRGWRRSMTWDRTGLTWVNPSPNMRSLRQALLYPGVGLLETTNLSVGRGTDTPFEVLGAPWMDGVALAAHLNARALPGVRFVPLAFTPRASAFEGQRCSGIELLITDWRDFRALPTGLELACALRDLFGERWASSSYLRLLGDGAAFEALRDGASADAIRAGWQPELRAFLKRREAFLLYP